MSPRLPRVTSPELLRALKRAGWEPVRQTGSHVHLTHPDRPGRIVTVAVHAGRLVPVGTLKTILGQAQLTGDDLRDLL
ncbi:MAG: addiction module toxin, HicA family [Chloroflexota bacterium]|nr:MAG: addiction module toxin, HicA family [Chloroflexota bacterium]